MWFTAILAALEEAPTVAAGLSTFFSHLHNEMAHGSGQSSPTQVTQEVLDGASSLISAITKNTAAEDEPDAQPAEPVAVSEAAESGTAESGGATVSGAAVASEATGNTTDDTTV